MELFHSFFGVDIFSEVIFRCPILHSSLYTSTPWRETLTATKDVFCSLLVLDQIPKKNKVFIHFLSKRVEWF